MRSFFIIMCFTLAVPATWAQVDFDSGSDGSDGILTVADSATLVLNMNDNPDGVFNFTSGSMGTDSRLEVDRNDDNTPLVLLFQDDFIMNAGAKIFVAGGAGSANGLPGDGGPGGFAGGTGGVDGPVPAAAGVGLGPGGGPGNIEGGDLALSAGRNTHMRPSLIPLTGGSGGGGGSANAAGNRNGGGGGAGGGAILIAVTGVFEMSPTSGTIIDARGGKGGDVVFDTDGAGGAGGAVRIIAGEIRGGSTIDCDGGTPSFAPGQEGIIRIETFRLTRGFSKLDGRAFISMPGLINADGTDVSTLRISSIGGLAVPADAGANVAMPDVIVPAGVSNPVDIVVTATDVTPGQTATIRLNYQGNGGRIIEATTGPLAGTNDLSTATASVNMDSGSGTIAAILETAPTMMMGFVASNRGEPSLLPEMKLTIQGERVTKIETVSEAGTARKQVVYLTASGRRAQYSAPAEPRAQSLD